MSYSQNDEEAAILKACANVEPKRFLDIGAFDPGQLSNTRALFEAGWGGVMIEPSPKPMVELLAAYGFETRIQLVHAAVGVEAGLRPMFITHGPVSTECVGAYEKWQAENTYLGQAFVPFVTLNQIFNQFGAGFGFVNIDTEGTSVELCLQLLYLAKDIPCICCEWDGDPRELMSHMTRADYALRYSNEENGVWQKMTWEESHL